MNFRAFVATFMFVSTAAAQVPPLPKVPRYSLDSTPAGADVIHPLRRNQPAPVDGQLFDSATALRWGNYLEQYRLRLDTCYDTADHLLQAERRYWVEVTAAQQEHLTAYRADALSRLAAQDKAVAKLSTALAAGTPWYSTREFGLVLGVTGTLSVLGLGLLVASSL
jgi:hypothetical protein